MPKDINDAISQGVRHGVRDFTKKLVSYGGIVIVFVLVGWLVLSYAYEKVMSPFNWVSETWQSATELWPFGKGDEEPSAPEETPDSPAPLDDEKQIQKKHFWCMSEKLPGCS